MLRTLTLSTLAALLLASCNNEETVVLAPVAEVEAPAPPPVTKGSNAITFPEDGYTTYDPITFIGYLQENVASGTVILHAAPKDWIKKKHLKPLVAMLDSKEPSAGVILKNAGPNPPDNVQSTVAAEALLLIESYRQKQPYPAVPGSLQFIKMLGKDPQYPDKLVLAPQPHLVKEAKDWAAKQ